MSQVPGAASPHLHSSQIVPILLHKGLGLSFPALLYSSHLRYVEKVSEVSSYCLTIPQLLSPLGVDWQCLQLNDMYLKIITIVYFVENVQFHIMTKPIKPWFEFQNSWGWISCGIIFKIFVSSLFQAP